MRISKSSLAEFKSKFPNFKEPDEEVEYSILTVGEDEAGVMKYVKSGTFDFVNIDKIKEDTSDPNFEYNLLMLFANEFERDYELENSYKEEEEVYSVYDKERMIEKELEDLKKSSRIYVAIEIVIVIILTFLVVIYKFSY